MNSASLVSRKQATLLAKRHAAKRRKRTFFLLLFFVLAVFFFWVIRQPFLRINEVKIQGSTLVSAAEVERYVKARISGYRYFVFPRNSILLISKDQLRADIMKEFPRLSEVSIGIGQRMNVAISEPIFESMYCSLSADTGLPTECVLLHPDGKAGSIAPVYSYPPFFAFYSTGYQAPALGARILSREEIDRVNGLKDEIVSYGIPVYGILYGAGVDEVLLDTGEDFKTLPRIKLLPGAKRDEVGKTLGIAIKDSSVSKLIENIYELSYIDLRFNGQVVYKKRGE